MRILAVHRYYWPDTSPYATLLRRIVRKWQQDGHQVEVLSGFPSYKTTRQTDLCSRRQVLDGVHVHRLSLPREAESSLIRICNAVRLGLSLIFKSVTKRYDVIMISTSPPILGGIAAGFASKVTGARFIFHCLDIHPEAGAITGEFSNPFIFNLFRKLDTWSCQKADPVIVLSEDMANTLQSRPGVKFLNIKILNNSSLFSSLQIPTDLPFEWPENRFTVLFAGNIGRFQGLEPVIEAMKLLRGRKDIAFIVMGEGSMKEVLKRKSTELELRIHFIDHQPVELAKAAMRRASVGYVSLSREIYKFAYPSKIMTYLEQGCPLIMSVESQSCIAKDVELGGYGIVVEPGDSSSLASKLGWLADSEDEVRSMSEMAILQSTTRFAEHRILEEWSNLLTQ